MADIVLRDLRESDIEDVALACADPDTQRFIDRLPAPYTREDAAAWVATATRSPGGPGAVWAIADPASDRLIGSVALGEASIGYWVAPWARGRGVGTAAAREATAWAFGHGYHRLELTTHLENVASQRIALALGYRPEGIRRGAVPARGGGHEDRVVFARLADDPDGPTRRLLPDLPHGALTDGVVTVRPTMPADAAHLHRLHTLPEVVATSVPPLAPSPETTRRRCAEAATNWLTGNRADMVICDAGTGAPAGDIGLYYDAPPLLEAMVGYSLLPEYRGRGLTARAVDLVAQWAFAQVGLARLVAGTAPDNVASQRVLERAGFLREAYQRAKLPGPGGTRIDNVEYVRFPAG